MNLIHESNVISIRELNPSHAAKILENRNLSNRKINKQRVSQYTSAMKSGDWEFNGDPIRFTSDGILSDGQHRLTALVMSGTTQSFLVIENMEKSSKLTIDAGKARNGGDTLAINMGVKNCDAATISGALKLYDKHNKAISLSDSGSGSLTNSRIARSYKENKKLVNECLSWIKGNTKIKGCILPRNELLFIMMITYEKSESESIKFINMFFNGLNISGKCPESFLRQYLSERLAKTRIVTQSEKLNTCIKAWNVIRSGMGAKSMNKILFVSVRDEFRMAT